MGDLVEGLCGDLGRARTQCEESIALVRQAVAAGGRVLAAGGIRSVEDARRLLRGGTGVTGEVGVLRDAPAAGSCASRR